MAKLVRARPKLPEFLPEWAKCCDRAMKAYAEEGEITVDLSTARKTGDSAVFCNWCNRPCPSVTRVLDVGNGTLVELELLDLDETGVPDGNYVTFAAAEQP